jgi:hypothetical protein
MTADSEAASGTAHRPGEGRLPNLVIAGVTKAGTTSLFRYLSQHPDVCPSDEKELRHFLPLRYGEPIEPLAAYAAHFRAWRGETVAMEASPGYFFGGTAVADAMAQALPDAQVVVVLREPGERAWSFFNFMRSRAKLPQDSDFEQWLDRCEQLVAEGVDQELEHHPFSGLGTGVYAQWLPAWTAAFGDRLRIVWFDDLTADPARTVAEICEWTGIDPGPAAGLEYHVENKTRQFKHARLQKAALAVNRQNKLFFERHQGVKRAVRRLYFLVNRAPTRSGMPASSRARLDRFYAPHPARLLEQLPPAALHGAPAWVRR